MSDTEAMRAAAGKFRRIVALARKRLEQGRHAQAAVAGQIAALYAAYDHHGVFIDGELESVMKALGAAALADLPAPQRARAPRAARVLQVLTAAKAVGGDTRYVRRLIERDSATRAGRSHSVALTNQMHFDVPPELREAVAASGGEVHVLDAGGAGALQRARGLRALAAQFDVVLLHVYVEDIVPLLAFFDATHPTPVAFMVQADHQFFMGLSASQLVVHLRESGAQLSDTRRGVDAARTGFLPIPLEPLETQGSREQARRELGIDPDAVVMLTIARAVKYSPIDGPAFATATLPALDKHPKAQLLAIGPDHKGPWAEAHARTGGRVRALGQRHDTRLFYEAADIYIDSFPFASNTSLLEAASHGLPLVTYFPYSDDASVLGAGAPGIDATMKRVHDLEQYTAALSELIADAALRRRLGDEGRHQFAQWHGGDGWQRMLDQVLAKALETPAGSLACDGAARGTAGELDRLLNQLYRQESALSAAIYRFVPELGYLERVSLLLELQRIDRSFSFGLFLPRWLERLLGRYLHGWRKLPLLRSLAGNPQTAAR
jgi:glycosyltransferase involved in cell wall biosynthesis